MAQADIGGLLAACARRLDTPRVDYYQALDFLRQYAERKSDSALLRLVKNHMPEFVSVLNDLERQGDVALAREGGTITFIEVRKYFGDALIKIYRNMLDSPGIAFPDKDALKMEFEPGDMEIIDVKSQFVAYLDRDVQAEEGIVRINFPEGTRHILIPAKLVRNKLVELALFKLSLYLQDQRNVGYLNSKLRSVFAGSEMVLTNLMNDVVGRPGKALQSLSEPGEFHLKFWTHLANLILQDLKKKQDKSPDDHGACQSCFVIGFYIVYQKGVQQRQKNRDVDLKRMNGEVKKAPYAFTLDAILSLTDRQGVAFTKKHSRQFVIDFIKERTKPEEPSKLPYLLRLRGPQEKEFFVQRDLAVPLFIKKVAEAGEELRQAYIELAVTSAKTNERCVVLSDDGRFAMDLKSRIQESYHLLCALLNPNLLYLSMTEGEISENAKTEMARHFTQAQKLRPIEDILGLNRKKLVKDSKALLPFWYTVPVVRQLVAFLKGLFVGKKKARKEDQGDWVNRLAGEQESPGRDTIAVLGDGEGDDAPATGSSATAGGRGAGGRGRPMSHSVAYQKQVNALVEEFVGTERKIDGTLEELSAKWNPLFEEKAKRNLVMDVDSLIRDFARSLRKGFRVKPPDAGRIRNLAGELSRKEALSKIRKKDYLQRYIEIYMIRLLLKPGSR